MILQVTKRIANIRFDLNQAAKRIANISPDNSNHIPGIIKRSTNMLRL